MIARYNAATNKEEAPPKGVSRRVAKPKESTRPRGGNYFPDEAVSKRFIPTGCTLLDCVLGGGWVIGRVENIVGDKSTGKTLLAIEACANFARCYPNGKIYYREAESAFDLPYAGRLGLPIDRVDFGPNGADTHWRTIEEVFKDLRKICTWHTKNNVPGLYILDSLDALTSETALKREIGEGSYNLEKQKILGQLFEQMISDFKEAQLCIIIVSQIRERIGFTVGEKYRRSGGKSLDFYASHIVWLSHMKTIVATRHGEQRATGIRILANCKKNKVGEPFRKCIFPIFFGYGIDDIEASVDWLVEKKMHERIGIVIKKKKEEEGKEKEKPKKGEEGKRESAASKAIGDYLDSLADLPNAEYAKRGAQIRSVVLQAWREVDGWFAPARKKY